ncbi:MAG: bifunctional helix-turn-helix transcriptional regulator/GNAT family N-acetyltransferase [Candidatus Hodarchaeales archaeon]
MIYPTLSETDIRIKSIRHFNRFYTRKIGVLREGLLHSPFSLTEARILFELALGDNSTASKLCIKLGLDPSYLSRILARFERKGLITRRKSDRDARQRLLNLTPDGQQAFSLLDKRSSEEIADMLNDLGEEDQKVLLKAMRTVENVLDKKLKYSEPFFLRIHGPGDMGWVTHRHGILYAREYGWDEHFESLVAHIVSEFINNYDPRRERCWIAEMGNEIVGSVFIVRVDEFVAKLRLLLVEPKARGMGLGSRLVEECIRFARQCGYQKIILWTNSVLVAARHVYEKKGFRLVDKESHHSFSQDLTGENWELVL